MYNKRCHIKYNYLGTILPFVSSYMFLSTTKVPFINGVCRIKILQLCSIMLFKIKIHVLPSLFFSVIYSFKNIASYIYSPGQKVHSPVASKMSNSPVLVWTPHSLVLAPDDFFYGCLKS